MSGGVLAGLGRLALVSVVPAALLAGTPAVATQVEHERFDEHVLKVRQGYCGDLTVRSEFWDQGVVVGRTTGRDGVARYTQSHHGRAVTTNLANGNTVTIVWNYLVQDVRATRNGDGTVTILWQVPGPETVYGPDGRRLAVSGGTMRIVTVLDESGTPDDPSDDVVVSEDVVMSVGGKPQTGEVDICDVLRHGSP